MTAARQISQCSCRSAIYGVIQRPRLLMLELLLLEIDRMLLELTGRSS